MVRSTWQKLWADVAAGAAPCAGMLPPFCEPLSVVSDWMPGGSPICHWSVARGTRKCPVIRSITLFVRATLFRLLCKINGRFYHWSVSAKSRVYARCTQEVFVCVRAVPVHFCTITGVSWWVREWAMVARSGPETLPCLPGLPQLTVDGGRWTVDAAEAAPSWGAEVWGAGHAWRPALRSPVLCCDSCHWAPSIKVIWPEIPMANYLDIYKCGPLAAAMRFWCVSYTIV